MNDKTTGDQTTDAQATAAAAADQSAPQASAPSTSPAQNPTIVGDFKEGDPVPDVKLNEIGAAGIALAGVGSGGVGGTLQDGKAANDLETRKPQASHPAQRQAAHVQRPSLCRIVVYRAADSGEMPSGNEFHAAMVTKINADTRDANLTVFPDGHGIFHVRRAVQSNVHNPENMAPGEWCWPPRS